MCYLTDHMRAEVCTHLHRDVLFNESVFKAFRAVDTNLVARILQRSYAAPGDMICDKGEEINFIIFIVSGSLEVTYDGAIAAILSKQSIW